MAQFKFTREMIEEVIQSVEDFLSDCEVTDITKDKELELCYDEYCIVVDFTYWTEQTYYRPERYNKSWGIWEEEECDLIQKAQIKEIRAYVDTDEEECEYVCDSFSDLTQKNIEYEV